MCRTFSFGQSVSKERATRMALLYAGTSNCESAPVSARSYNPNGQIDTTHTFVFSITNKAPLYVVQMDEGWVMVSSELATQPILASAPEGTFPDVEDMPDGMRWLFSYYEEALQYARDSLSTNNIDARWNATRSYFEDEFRAELNSRNYPSDSLERMQVVAWGQGRNNNFSCITTYNKFCPTWYDVSCGRTVVGCGAVALGQILWFWQWPNSAIIPNTIDTAGNTSDAKHLVRYDWTLMPTTMTSITPIEKVDAVAGLLRDCGYVY